MHPHLARRSAREARQHLAALLLCAAAALLPAGEARAQHMTFLHTAPASAQAGKDLTIVGNIFGGADLAKAKCHYRQRGGSFKSVELVLQHGDVFKAVIPGRDVLPPSIEYFCVASDYFGGQSELYASRSAPRRVRVVGEYKPPPEPEEAEAKARPPPEEKPRDKGREPDRGREQEPERAPEPEKSEDKAARDDELALFGAEDVVTLATRQTQSVSEAPAIAAGVPEEQMRTLGLRTLPDVLKTVPGLETSRDVQGFWRVATRGIRDDAALLVMYDGHRLNSPYDARAPLNLPLENAERVEVVRGPGSALYGAGAVLGVVNVVSKRRESVEAAASGGSFGTFDGHVSAGHKWGDLGLYGDADFLHSDGYRRPVSSDALTTTLERQGKKDVDAPAGLTNDRDLFANVGGELRYGTASGGMTRVGARVIHEDRAALVGLFDAVGHDSDLAWDVLLLDAVHERPLPFGGFNARLYFDHQAVDRLFQIAPAGYGLAANVTAPKGLFERTDFTAQALGLDLGLDATVGQAHKLSAGLSGALTRLPSYAYTVNFEGATVFDTFQAPSGLVRPQSKPEFNRRLVFGAYAQDVWKIVSSLSLTLGLRGDITELPNVTAGAAESATVSGTKFVPTVNPRLGLVFVPAEGWNVKLLYGRAFRAPTLQELAERTPNNDFSNGRFTGNPNLEPATIDTVEAGVEMATAVGENKLRLRGNGFLNHIGNPISAIDTSGNVIPLSNRKEGVDVVGAEGELRFEISSRAYTLINYAWFRGWDEAAPEGFQYLTDVPQYRANAAVALPLGRFVDFSILGQLGSERRNLARSKLETLRIFRIPAYAIIGAQLRTQPIADHYDVALTAQNLFDYDLRDDVPRPDRMPGLLPREGLGVYLTVRARY